MMRDKILTYPEQFPPGSRVTIKASPHEGTDHRFNKRNGTVKEWPRYTLAEVEFDEPPHGLPNPYLIVCHNLRHLTANKS
jgi:hypothetical protein